MEKELSLFYENMESLKDKILALLIQLPPSYELQEGLDTFRNYDFFFDDTFRYAIEVGHSSCLMNWLIICLEIIIYH